MTLYINKINEILHKEWDPIGVKCLDCTEDEYITYAHEILNIIKLGFGKDKVFQYLILVEKDILEIKPNLAHTRRISEKIINIGIKKNE